MRLSGFVVDFQYDSGASVVSVCIMVSHKSAAPFLAGPRLKDRVTRLSHGRNAQGRERGPFQVTRLRQTGCLLESHHRILGARAPLTINGAGIVALIVQGLLNATDQGRIVTRRRH